MRAFADRCYDNTHTGGRAAAKAHPTLAERLKRAEQRIAELDEYCDNLLERIEALESFRQIGDFSG